MQPFNYYTIKVIDNDLKMCRLYTYI